MTLIEKDTVKLLRECDAGIKMGIESIDEVLPHVHSSEFKNKLSDCKAEHEKLKGEIHKRLNEFQDDGKEPNPIAKSMSWIKTNIKMEMNDSDQTIADLIIDGCDMGVKSLSKYLNKYKAADEFSKDITKKLIKLEEQLGCDIRVYL